MLNNDCHFIKKRFIEDLRRIYSESNLITKIHVFVRFASCPFLKILRYLPQKGIVIDYGCGYGLFLFLSFLSSSETQLVGFDPDLKKIKDAKKIAKSLTSRISLHTEDILKLNGVRVDCITIIDVLYLIPYQYWLTIFQRCYERLSDTGILLVKEMDKKPKWKALWNMLQETLSVRIFNITLGKNFYFKESSEFIIALKKSGFNVSIIRLDKGYIHPHVLYICTKS